MEIRIRVKPGTSKGDEVVTQIDGSYLVYLRAKPIGGQANIALVKLLAKHFSVAKSRIIIKNGTSSHYKTVIIDK